MPSTRNIQSIAVIGAGIAGAACAASLQRAGLDVSLFDKSRGLGGRMATRRVSFGDAGQFLEFDHGAQHITAQQPRFRGVMSRAAAAGVVAPWRQRVHAAWPAATVREGFVPVPGMPALCRHLLGDVPVQLGRTVQRLHRTVGGWQLIADGEVAGEFSHVVLAMPPAQAAALLVGHHDSWAEALDSLRMEPCWTLMAATPELDWPWDAAVPDRGPLAWVARNDRAPGRSVPAGIATWVAQATPAWSAEHLEDSAESVTRALCAALAQLMPGQQTPPWLHAVVHRWRYAMPAGGAPDRRDCWWDAEHGLGVCGDFLTGGGVEAAWRSGDELACTMAASLEETLEAAEVA